MKMKFVLVTISINFVLSIASGNTACKARTPFPADLTPLSFRSWLQANTEPLSDPGDLLCCLPEVYRQKYIILHSSDAGQNGSPESPRILLSPDLSNRFSLTSSKDVNQKVQDTMIFTINGGASYLNQKEAVEIFNYNRKTDSIDYFDLEKTHSGKFALSEKNPKSCMVCHGERGQVPKSGPRPLFDNFDHWPRVVGGAKRCNPDEDRLQLLKQKKALEAIRDNPRFSCLDKTKITKALKMIESKGAFNPNGHSSLSEINFEVFEFDRFLDRVNDKRVFKIVSQSPDYQAYKFLIFGDILCGSNEIAAHLNEWMPSTIQANHSDVSFASSENSSIRTLEDLRNRLSQLRGQSKELQQSQKAEAQKRSKVDQTAISPGTNFYSCGEGRTPRFAEEGLRSALEINNPVLRAYTIDRWMNTPPNTESGTISAISRYIFEGRGINISDWSMDLGRGQYRGNPTIDDLLLETEPENSPLRRILAPRTLGMSTYDKATSEKIKKEVCNNLKRASHDALLKLQVQTTKKNSNQNGVR